MTDRLALYPGTFDPVTLGHMDILARALALFDRVVVLVAEEGKAGFFPLEERVALFRAATAGMERCEIQPFSGLFVEQVEKFSPVAVIRGIRSAMDYEHEWALAGVNRTLWPESEYVFLLARPELAPLSSTLVRDVARHGGSLTKLVPAAAARALDRRFGRELPDAEG